MAKTSFLDDYEPVAVRLEKFWADHPDGSVYTTLIEEGDPVHAWVVKAALQVGDVLIATGHARQELLTEPPGGNRYAPEYTSPVEVCETSAIGRALANAGYAAKPSREEMSKAGSKGAQGGSDGPLTGHDRAWQAYISHYGPEEATEMFLRAMSTAGVEHGGTLSDEQAEELINGLQA